MRVAAPAERINDRDRSSRAQIRSMPLREEPVLPEETELVTIDAAVEIFFGDLRLAPRSKKTYRNGIEKFLRHLRVHEGIDTAMSPVTVLNADHVTSFASMIVPPDIRTPEEVSQMRTAQNNLS